MCLTCVLDDAPLILRCDVTSRDGGESPPANPFLTKSAAAPPHMLEKYRTPKSLVHLQHRAHSCDVEHLLSLPSFTSALPTSGRILIQRGFLSGKQPCRHIQHVVVGAACRSIPIFQDRESLLPQTPVTIVSSLLYYDCNSQKSTQPLV